VSHRLQLLTLLIALFPSAILATASDSGEILYNGIVLPREWPPRLEKFPTNADSDPVTPPYLISPPAVIPIDVGRQLFVDDFLIESTTLKRTFHLPTYFPANPVLKPDQPWEMTDTNNPAAFVFSDGVWFDPKDRFFKMWYMGGQSAATGYAISRDGIHWKKPKLDVRPGTNIVEPNARDSSTIWLDAKESDPARRFKMFRVFEAGKDPSGRGHNCRMTIQFSADGIHWSEPLGETERIGDRSTVFWNPFRKKWVFSLRYLETEQDEKEKRPMFIRKRAYVEGADALAAARWKTNDVLPWSDVDRLDPQRPELKTKPQIYNVDAVAYESVMVGLFTIWRGQPANRQKPNDIVVGYSRDGWNWWRPDRRAFCPVSDHQGDWNANNVQSAGGGFLVVRDKLYFYVSGRSGRPGGNRPGEQSTGLATLRRDGFASMDADEAGGVLTTRPLRFSGKYLFVNVDDPRGELKLEVLNANGDVIPQFTAAKCNVVKTDKTLRRVTWSGSKVLSSLANQPVRFRFNLKNGSLYSFWVSPESNGASHGYVAAGGPGFSSNKDGR
jgi:hypothetical protein